MRDFMTEHPVIALDFDGTIKSTNDFNDMSTPPNPNAIEVIKKLKNLGCELILWTSREGEKLDAAKEYLAKYDILDCFVSFNEPAPSCTFPQGRKIFANYYVDDLNLDGFNGFLDLYAKVLEDITEYKKAQI